MSDPKKVVLVTGGTRGIGAVIAESFAKAGFTVAICGRNPPGPDCPHDFYAADLREAEACAHLIAKVHKAHGRLDVLVNNAGGAPPADTATVSPRFSEKIIRLNLLAPLWLSQEANTVMQAQANGGVIVNIASVAGLRPAPSVAAYGAAKAGLLNLAQTMAMEFGPKVRVLSISPGLVATAEALAQYAEAFEALDQDKLCTPQQVGESAVWLACSAALCATGTNLILDGPTDLSLFGLSKN
jgi:NAD(P)-dependent dehydrogenase (short-subunit alcohol dehydrogenase family)